MSANENLQKAIDLYAAGSADVRFDDILKSVVALMNAAYSKDPAWAIQLAAGLCFMAMGYDLDAQIAMAEKSRKTLQ